MLTEKKNVVYFDSIPTPNATPTASHHSPRPVSWSLTKVSIKNAIETTSALSGVASAEPAAMRMVRLK